MNTTRWSLLVTLLVAANVTTAALVLTRDAPVAPRNDAGDPARSAEMAASIDRLEGALAALAARVDARPRASSETGDAGETAGAAESVGEFHELAPRVDGLERAVSELREAVDSLDAASVEPLEPADFREEDGVLHADALAEAGKHAAAADGYLEFLDAFPDHVDAYDISHRARGQLLGAGYVQRAIDLQKEIIERYPEEADRDYSTLATMEKRAERYDDAIEHMDQSIERTADSSTKLWRLMYRAWYVQLRDGEAAGLAAYRDVDRIRRNLGVEGKIQQKISEKISMLEDRLVRSGR